jgi:hypothetical protein
MQQIVGVFRLSSSSTSDQGRTTIHGSRRAFLIWCFLSPYFATQGVLHGSTADNLRLALNAVISLLIPVLLLQNAPPGTGSRRVALVLSTLVLGFLAFKVFDRFFT